MNLLIEALLMGSGTSPHYDEKWDFSFADISQDYDRMMLYAGPDKFRKMFDAFTFFCFKCEGFEIVQILQWA